MNREERRKNKKQNAASPGKNWKAKFRAPNLRTKLFSEISPEVQAMKRAVHEHEEKQNAESQKETTVFSRMLDSKLNSEDPPQVHAQAESPTPMPRV